MLPKRRTFWKRNVLHKKKDKTGSIYLYLAKTVLNSKKSE
jgi:hypothetical protein